MQSRQCDIFSNRHLFLPDHEPLFMVRFLFYLSPNAAASGTAKPGGMYRKQIQKVHIVFSSIDKRTATASPLLRYYVKKYIIYTKMLIYSLLCNHFFLYRRQYLHISERNRIFAISIESFLAVGACVFLKPYRTLKGSFFFQRV